jgi:hypothetical protein
MLSFYVEDFQYIICALQKLEGKIIKKGKQKRDNDE